jgi:hypothetical protein
MNLASALAHSREMRVNHGRDFVIAWYTPGPRNFDPVCIGYYEGDRLLYSARTRNGFTPASREAPFQVVQRDKRWW